MSIISFDTVLKGGLKLSPVSREIEGLDEPVLIQQFSWDDFEKLLEPPKEDEKNYLVKQVIMFMRGMEPEPTEEEIVAIKKSFSMSVIRKIFQVGLEVNGTGKAAESEAKKK